MKPEDKNRPSGFKLYYCVRCGFARVFWSDNPQFNSCPACGNDIYVESSLDDEGIISAEDKFGKNLCRSSYIRNKPRC